MPDGERISAYARSGAHPPAVVCDASFVNGLTAIRSLGRMGVPVFAVDHRPSALGFRSRYALALPSADLLIFYAEDGSRLSLAPCHADRVARPWN